MSIYNRIEFLIKSHSLTKKSFCEELKISTGNLGDWRRGKSTPSTNKLIEIAAFFDVSLDWLLTGRERVAQPAGGVSELPADYVFRGGEALNTELEPAEREFIQEYIAFAKYRKLRRNSGGN
ncbi:helix-turn-helix domain-containing protein [Paenibacillus brevis]|uniref:Helix-turn-helix domain-containing protein n=1 Tax=Paenibacillus brevis TaxID=2841508 RepID=A0ABS6FNI8_9BACL|nr:helix-turn-helix domain-containing protein [Paenibacillus brevis]